LCWKRISSTKEPLELGVLEPQALLCEFVSIPAKRWPREELILLRVSSHAGSSTVRRISRYIDEKKIVSPSTLIEQVVQSWLDR
jgi:hypothetical protein